MGGEDGAEKAGFEVSSVKCLVIRLAPQASKQATEVMGCLALVG